MQLFARSTYGGVENAKTASKKEDYSCLECGKIVRLREGPLRQPHFYHLAENVSCKQSQKSMPHLQLQLFLLNTFGCEEAELEVPFDSIKRIADVYWKREELIFEIQCSPISSEEVMARNKDYESLGKQVVWIFHDKKFNQWHVSAAEKSQLGAPHYFSNMTNEGKGIIYDQFSLIKKGVRIEKKKELLVDLLRPKRCEKSGRVISFYGDFLSLKDAPNEAKAFYYLEDAMRIEAEFSKGSEKRGSFKEKTVEIALRMINQLESGFRDLLRVYCE